MKQYFVINPEKKVYHVMAEDQFEALHKAKRIDGHIYQDKQYQVLAKRKEKNLQVKK